MKEANAAVLAHHDLRIARLLKELNETKNPDRALIERAMEEIARLQAVVHALSQTGGP